MTVTSGSTTESHCISTQSVDSTISLLENDQADGEILSIGSTDNIDSATFAEVIRNEINPSRELEYGEPREGDAEYTHADISKAAELLDYEPATGIREEIQQFIDWYRENQSSVLSYLTNEFHRNAVLALFCHQ